MVFQVQLVQYLIGVRKYSCAVNKVVDWGGKTYNEQIRPAVTTVYQDVSGLAKQNVSGITKLKSGAGDFLSNSLTPIALGTVAIGALILLRK